MYFYIKGTYQMPSIKIENGTTERHQHHKILEYQGQREDPVSFQKENCEN